MSLFQFPFKRISRPTLGNPVFVDDIVAANQAVLDGIGFLFNNTPFAIVSGLLYTPGSPGSYSPGLVWLQGTGFCWVSASFSEGLFLRPSSTEVNPEPYSDTNTQDTYTLLQAVAGSSGASPVFSLSMNQYRMDLATLKASAISAANTISELGNSAFHDVGTTTGFIAAADDPRLVGDAGYFDARYAQRVNVIEKGTSTAYTPTGPNDPVNKLYADQFVKILAKGYVVIGDADTSGGTTHTIALGLTLPDTNYAVYWSLESYNVNPAIDTFYQLTIVNKTTTSFGVRFREAQTGVQNVNLAWSAQPL